MTDVIEQGRESVQDMIGSMAVEARKSLISTLNDLQLKYPPGSEERAALLCAKAIVCDAFWRVPHPHMTAVEAQDRIAELEAIRDAAKKRR